MTSLNILDHNTRLVAMLQRAVPFVDSPLVSQRRRMIAASMREARPANDYQQSVNLTFTVHDLWPIVYVPHDAYKTQDQREVAEAFSDIIRNDYLSEIKPHV